MWIKITLSKLLAYILNQSLAFLDVNDLQNFVNISLATAAGGEGDLARDKLSNLRTVGSGFGALIYKLPPDAGYETLVDRCKSLWETLKSTPKLPDMMVCTICNCECPATNNVLIVERVQQGNRLVQVSKGDTGFC